jgi:Flp pilus assembly protein TadD
MKRTPRATFVLTLCVAAALLPTIALCQSCHAPDSMQAALAHSPTADTFADLGIFFANQKQYVCAADAFATSLSMKPDSANVQFMLGTSLFFSGHAEEAIAPLQAAEQTAGWQLKTHLLLAAVYDQVRRFDDARTEWQAALAVDPESTEALGGLAQDLVQSQSYTRTIELLEAPRAQRLRTAAQSLSLGTAYATLGQTDRAIAALRDGLNTTPDSLPIANELADILAQSGRTDDAVALLAMSRELHPDDLDTRLHILRLLITANSDKAQLTGQQILQAFPKSWEAFYLNGVLATQNGDPNQARLYLSQSMALNPDFALTHSLLGIVLARMNDMPAAKTELERAIALGDTSEDVQQNLARVTAAIH